MIEVLILYELSKNTGVRLIAGTDTHALNERHVKGRKKKKKAKDIYFEDIRVEAAIEYKNLEIILTEAERYGNGRMGSI